MAETMEFLPRAQVLTIEELIRTARLFTELGVRKIRVTGGEPLIRRGIDELFSGLGNLPYLETLALTTNGSQLANVWTLSASKFIYHLPIVLDS